MARPRSYTDGQAERIRALAQAGASAPMIHERLLADGAEISLRTVQNLLAAGRGKRRRPAKRRRGSRAEPKKSAPRAPASADESGAPAAPSTPEGSDEEQRALLSDLLRDVVSSAKEARREKDVGAALAAARLATALSQAIQRIPMPEVPVDPNELPDMIAAAERGRAKLFDYVQRAVAGKS